MTEANCQTIVHCPRCAAGDLNWPTPKHFTCVRCGFVMYLNIAAAVAVIIEWDKRLLFGLRRYDPGKGRLDLPGGFVNQGETAEEAALREVREETGIVLPQLHYLYSFPNIYPYRELVYDTVDLIYCCRLSAEPAMQAADDLEQLLWIDRDRLDVARIAFPSLRSAVERYLQDH